MGARTHLYCSTLSCPFIPYFGMDKLKGYYCTQNKKVHFVLASKNMHIFHAHLLSRHSPAYTSQLHITSALHSGDCPAWQYTLFHAFIIQQPGHNYNAKTKTVACFSLQSDGSELLCSSHAQSYWASSCFAELVSPPSNVAVSSICGAVVRWLDAAFWGHFQILCLPHQDMALARCIWWAT